MVQVLSLLIARSVWGTAWFEMLQRRSRDSSRLLRHGESCSVVVHGLLLPLFTLRRKFRVISSGYAQQCRSINLSEVRFSSFTMFAELPPEYQTKETVGYVFAKYVPRGKLNSIVVPEFTSRQSVKQDRRWRRLVLRTNSITYAYKHRKYISQTEGSS